MCPELYKKLQKNKKKETYYTSDMLKFPKNSIAEVSDI